MTSAIGDFDQAAADTPTLPAVAMHGEATPSAAGATQAAPVEHGNVQIRRYTSEMYSMVTELAAELGQFTGPELLPVAMAVLRLEAACESVFLHCLLSVSMQKCKVIQEFPRKIPQNPFSWRNPCFPISCRSHMDSERPEFFAWESKAQNRELETLLWAKKSLVLHTVTLLMPTTRFAD